MLDTLTNALASNGFLPHGYCFQWTPGLLWAYVVSDSLIAVAYYSIPCALWYFVRKRTDLPFNWIFVMFGIFILSCGTTHLTAVWNIWQPVYWLDATLKMFTAAASIATAIVLWPLIPKALRLPHPSELIALNHTLVREVAERRQAEAWARDLAANLERKVAELKQSNEALTRSNLELQRFAYVASHDLQTPMRGVASFVELLRSRYADKLDAQANDWIDRIIGSVKHLQNLVRDLLEYSRVDARPQPFEAVNMREVFDQALSLMGETVHDAGTEVSCGELPLVMGDRTQLAQLMLNLIGNGLKYRGSVPPRVHVSAQLGAEGWVFAVRDNGIGIDAQFHERIFEVFQRLHGPKEYPGTGIGLAICRRVVHRHGGRVWVESEPGSGSVFYFTIPERKADLS